jgi:hypothetical protein
MKIKLLIVIFITIYLISVSYHIYKVDELNNLIKIEREKYYSDVNLLVEYQDALNIYLDKDSICSAKLYKIMDSLNLNNFNNNIN